MTVDVLSGFFLSGFAGDADKNAIRAAIEKLGKSGLRMIFPFQDYKGFPGRERLRDCSGYRVKAESPTPTKEGEAPNPKKKFHGYNCTSLLQIQWDREYPGQGGKEIKKREPKPPLISF